MIVPPGGVLGRCGPSASGSCSGSPPCRTSSSSTFVPPPRSLPRFDTATTKAPPYRATSAFPPPAAIPCRPLAPPMRGTRRSQPGRAAGPRRPSHPSSPAGSPASALLPWLPSRVTVPRTGHLGSDARSVRKGRRQRPSPLFPGVTGRGARVPPRPNIEISILTLRHACRRVDFCAYPPRPLGRRSRLPDLDEPRGRPAACAQGAMRSAPRSCRCFGHVR